MNLGNLPHLSHPGLNRNIGQYHITLCKYSGVSAPCAIRKGSLWVENNVRAKFRYNKGGIMVWIEPLAKFNDHSINLNNQPR